MIHASERFDDRYRQEILVAELTHRVNNEYASVIGLIHRAAAGCNNSAARALLVQMKSAVQAFARVHHALMVPRSAEPVRSDEYFGELCAAMSQSRLENAGIRLQLTTGTDLMDAYQCWRLGLIASELVTNSARHAFFSRIDGLIRVAISKAGGQFRLVISDDGDASRARAPGRGLRILNDLARSLPGTFEQCATACGTTSIVCFEDLLSAT